MVVSGTSMMAAVISPSRISQRYSKTYGSIPAGTGRPPTMIGAGDMSARVVSLLIYPDRSRLRRERGRRASAGCSITHAGWTPEAWMDVYSRLLEGFPFPD